MKIKKIILCLCLLNVSCIALAQSRLSNREIFNFEVGTIIHTLYTNHAPPVYTKRSFLDKQFSKNKDTVFYEVLDSVYTLQKPTTWQLNLMKHTIYYAELDSLPYPKSSFSNPKSYYHQISYAKDYDKCGILVNKVVFSNFPDSINILPGEKEVFQESYYQGFGAYYEHKIPNIDPQNPYIYFSLLYYKNSIFECGERIENLASNRNISKWQSILIYPNPVKDKIRIEDTEKGDFAIYNILGEKVISGILEKEIDLSILPEGLYYLKIVNEDNNYIAKFKK